MKATFDLDERTLAQILRLIKQGDLNQEREDKTDFTGTPVQMWLADEDVENDKPHTGLIDFTDNNVDSSTGTYRVRGAFPNPDDMLVPGMFVRVRVPIGKPQKALLIEEKALVTDQGQKYVYVVKQKNSAEPVGTVEYRNVKLGRLHHGKRVIKDGLKPDEGIIVSGLQRVRQEVKDFEVKFKDLGAANSAAQETKDPTKSKSTSEGKAAPLKSPDDPAKKEGSRSRGTDR
jgi:multidrug efflux system membrane fusion protein